MSRAHRGGPAVRRRKFDVRSVPGGNVRLRASLGFRTATAADAGLTPWYHVCPRDRFLATVRRRLDEALPGLENARELRKARREAIYASLEELGLIKRTQGGR